MYIVDGIAYAGHPQEALKIVHIRILDDLYMMVTFASGEKRLFDVSPLMSYPVYAPLTDPAIFLTAAVQHGMIVWSDGDIDIAPETVYEKSFPYNDASPKSA